MPPEFDFQEGTIVNDIHSATNPNNHFRIGDNTSLVGGGVILKTSLPTPLSTLEVGNNNTIALSVIATDLIMGDSNSIGDWMFVRGIDGLTGSMGDNNIMDADIGVVTRDNYEFTLGEGNNFKQGAFFLAISTSEETIRTCIHAVIRLNIIIECAIMTIF
jgi:hypothetical protein